MNLTDALLIGTAATTILSATLGMWNAWTNKNTALAIAELRLNIQREMNGRYIRIETFGDLKERVGRLEKHEDEEKPMSVKVE